MLVPKLKAPKGYIRLNETSYDKLVNYHFANGFCILTAFRSEFTMSQNRARNKKLAADLKSNDLGFIRVTGGYREVIDKDNVNWDDAEKIPDNDEKRLLTIMEESLLVPNFDVKTKQPFEDFDKLKDIIIDLGIKYEQDSVLVSPPNSDGNAYYVITNERYGDLGDIDIKFDKMDLASITDTYFSSLSKTINKLKVKRGDGVGGFKFEKKKYVCTFVDEPRHTLSGMRSENASGALPVFGSHYYETSTLAKKVKTESASKIINEMTVRNTSYLRWRAVVSEALDALRQNTNDLENFGMCFELETAESNRSIDTRVLSIHEIEDIWTIIKSLNDTSWAIVFPKIKNYISNSIDITGNNDKKNFGEIIVMKFTNGGHVYISVRFRELNVSVAIAEDIVRLYNTSITEENPIVERKKK